MRVKKFEAKSMKEALQMVKKELGPDAVILAARDNRRSFGIGGDPSVEITAAVSESTLQKKRFVESRLTAQARDRFQESDARTQRKIIEKMVDNRTKPEEKPPRRPITSVSYIDIQDEEADLGARRAAYDRARGRNVGDLLRDFSQDFDQDMQDDDQWQARPTREVARAVPARAQVRREEERRAEERREDARREEARPTARRNPNRENSEAARAPGRETPTREAPTRETPTRETPEVPPTERAIARIKSAAREAWKNNPFMEEERAAREAKPEPSARAQATTPSVSATRSQAQAVVRAQGAAGLGSVEAASPAPPARDTEIADLKGEINRLQTHLEKMMQGFQKVPQTFVSMHPGAEYGISYDLSFMFQKLVEAGVTIDNTVEILQQAAKEIDPVQVKKRSLVDAWVARFFLGHVTTNSTPWHGRLHLFVGGAGSGKTSTLVKMASHLVVKERKKIAILSTDSFKVGAVDQLKIYCQILNVPFAVLRSRKDWEWVLSQLNHVDHILVDFPGFQLRDLDEIHAFKGLLPPEGFAPVTHYCASATSKDGDAYEMAKRYKVAEFSDLIFTNLDQSVQHGIIYNLHKKTGKPLHSFGIGNRIPEDFEAATKERVLDLIFKLTKLKRETK